MVEWKKLGEVCEIGTGSNNREDACDNGCYPFYVRSQEVLKIDSYSYDEEAILIPGEGGIGDIFHYINGKYGLHQRTYRVHPITGDVKGRYIYYFLFANFKIYINAKSYKSTAASIRKPMLLDFPIPIPSLEEQTRIVGILDTFTSAIDNLKEQIAQRRKQYEYYRDQLLDLEGKPGVEWFELLELCDYVDYRGKTPSKVDAGIFLVTAKNIRKGYIDYDNSKEYISEDDYEEVMHRGKPQIGDVLVTTEAPLGNVAQIDNENIALAQRVIKYRPKDERLNSSYLKYILLGSEFQIRLEKEATGATAKGIKGSKLHRMHIPLPPLSEQQRIVSILDTFEASIQNLEAQLKQREKQYEYYRNKLLTFE